jgi:Tetrapyrrole (Corrin/Porphyrin) Methylases
VHHISLIGTGIDIDAHLTPEAIDAIGQCRRIYHLTAHHDRLVELCPAGEIINWNDLYTSTHATSVYDEMAEAILAAASGAPGVGFVTYGHPLVLVDTSRMVVAAATARGMSVRVISGISSIDVLLQHLLLETGLAGLQVLEVNHMVLYDLVPNPFVSALIMQVAAFGARSRTMTRANHPQRFVRLREFLGRVYPDRHPLVLITAPFRAGMPLIVRQTTVAELPAAHQLIHTGMSMYIPARGGRQPNPKFVEQLLSEAQAFAEDPVVEAKA